MAPSSHLRVESRSPSKQPLRAAGSASSEARARFRWDARFPDALPPRSSDKARDQYRLKTPYQISGIRAPSLVRCLSGGRTAVPGPSSPTKSARIWRANPLNAPASARPPIPSGPASNDTPPSDLSPRKQCECPVLE